MNSINMLDNMDAISTLVSFTILVFSVLISADLGAGEGIYRFVLTGVCASLAAFVFYNWYPSRMFMGDTGSQLLGVFLAAAGIHSCLGAKLDVSMGDSWIRLVCICLLFCIPIIDTSTVIINRILRGKSPFIGGKDHTTHSLFYRGLTERRIAILFTGLSVVGGLGAYYLLHTHSQGYVLSTLFFSYFILLFITLFILNRISIR
jgi:UDP-GlcNAc:undecaprenyl-phosphate GlcNAc-1-phosphate transferase